MNNDELKMEELKDENGNVTGLVINFPISEDSIKSLHQDLLKAQGKLTQAKEPGKVRNALHTAKEKAVGVLTSKPVKIAAAVGGAVLVGGIVKKVKESTETEALPEETETFDDSDIIEGEFTEVTTE